MILRPAPRLAWVLLVGASVGQGAAILWTSQAGWLGWLPAGVASLERTSIFGASLAGAGAAWAAGSLRSHGLDAWARASNRTPNELDRAPFWWAAASAVVATSTLAVAILVGSIQSLSPSGVFRLALSAGAVVGVAFCAAALGVFMGRHLPTVIAVALAAFLPYLVAIALGVYLGGSPASRLTVPDYRAYDYSWPSTDAVIARTACVLALSAWATLWLYEAKRVRTAAGWTASFAMATVFILAGPAQPIPKAESITCTGSDPVICFDGTQGRVRAGYVAEASRLWSLIPAASRPKVIAATDLSVGQGDAVSIPPLLGKYRPSKVLDREALTALFGDTAFATSCSQQEITNRSEVLRIWWLRQHGLSLDGRYYPGQTELSGGAFSEDRDAAARLDAMGQSQRAALLDRFALSLKDCDARMVRD
jgi:hypothetical protein